MSLRFCDDFATKQTKALRSPKSDIRGGESEVHSIRKPFCWMSSWNENKLLLSLQFHQEGLNFLLPRIYLGNGGDGTRLHQFILIMGIFILEWIGKESTQPDTTADRIIPEDTRLEHKKDAFSYKMRIRLGLLKFAF